MSWRHPIKPKAVDLVAISTGARFMATITHGKGTRNIAVDVPAALILKLADAIRATSDGQCGAYDRPAYGHSVWHVLNPDMPMPCVRGHVIDVTQTHSLTEGTDADDE